MNLKGATNSNQAARGTVSSGSSLAGAANSAQTAQGELSPAYTIRSALNSPTMIRGKSAYEIALIHGFKGTEAEWLASLKGNMTDEDLQKVIDEVAKIVTEGMASARIGEVTIYADSWVGNASPYSQVVFVSGATENSQVDLTPSVEQLAIFYEKDLAFVTENDGGIVTVYAIGQKPANDYTIQVTITEVEV